MTRTLLTTLCAAALAAAFSGPANSQAARPQIETKKVDGTDNVYIFRNGKMHPSDRPGLGVVPDLSKLNQITEFTERAPASLFQGESLHRPDGSHLYL